MTDTRSILTDAAEGKRLTESAALALARDATLHDLASHASKSAIAKNGKRVAYLVDRNVNYTNVCVARCSFCAFYRPAKHREGYDLPLSDIDQKVRETLDMGGTRILMQGGLHPDHTVATYENLVSHIRDTHGIHVHAFSPPEIHHVASKAGLSYREVLLRLKKAGLGSMPGGGAEILVERVRAPIAVGKCNVEEWLDIMSVSHEVGIKSTATMMMGHTETWEDRIEHLRRLRDVQDKTGGFLSFIPWTFQPDNTALHPKIRKNKSVKLAGAYEYLRFLAIARLYLDNFDHIQVSLLTQGAKVAQIGLHFGADDLGSLLIEENVVRLAGCPQEADLKRQTMRKIIEEAGFEAYERDTFYNTIESHTTTEARVVNS